MVAGGLESLWKERVGEFCRSECCVDRTVREKTDELEGGRLQLASNARFKNWDLGRGPY